MAALFAQTDASIAGVFVALDRQERGQGEPSADGKAKSAIQEVQDSLGVPVRSIVSMEDIIGWLDQQPDREEERAAMDAYRVRYGVSES